MLADNGAVLPDDNAVGIGLDLDRPPTATRADRELFAVEATQAGLGNRGLRAADPFEPPADGHELGARRFKPARPFGRSLPDAGWPWRKRHTGRAARRSAPHNS